MEIGAYNFHSPDTQFRKGNINGDRIKVDLELNGQGYHYGLYAEGEEPEDKYDQKVNQKGARVAINMNHYREPTIIPGDDKEIVVPDEDIECDCYTGTFEVTKFPFIGETLALHYDLDLEGVTPYYAEGTVTITASYGGFSDTDTFEIDGNIQGDFQYTYSGSSSIRLKIVIEAEEPTGCIYEAERDVNAFFPTPSTPQEAKQETDIYTYPNICGEPPGTDDDTEPEAGTDVTTKHLRRCLRAIRHADSDRKVSKEDDFTYSLLNFYRESSVYLELDHDGPQLFLGDSIDRFLGDRLYNGTPYGNLGANHTCDGSFFGDVFTHHRPIHHASSWYGAVEQYNPDQYGRVETLQYVDLGLSSDNINCGCVEGPVGDTYIAMHSFKRTAYVSDKVGENVGRPITLDFLFENDLVSLLEEFGFFSNISDFTGLRDCGLVPLHMDEDDPRNIEGGTRINLKDTWNGSSGFNGFSNNGGRYYPAVLTTLIHFPVETEVNLHYRKTGEEEIGEVHYRDLEGLEYDSDVNQGANWEDCWMNEFYAELPEMSPRTKMSKLFLYMGVRLGIPFASFSAAAGVQSVAVSTPILAMGGALTFMLNRFLDDHIDQFLGGPTCKSDEEGGPGDGIIEGFKDNYYGYNWDYSHQSIETYYGVPDPYNTCPCLDDQTNMILYSEKQTLGSPIDAYRNFQVNNYIELSAKTGPIQNMMTVGHEIYVHTTDNIWRLFGKQSQLTTDGGSRIYLGEGSLFQNAKEIYGSIVEGYAGIKDPNAAVNTKMGYMFIDREARQLHMFNSSGIQGDEVFKGMYAFFKEHLNFKLLEDFPDFKNVDEKSPTGIGYNMGMDHRYNRLVLTKNDYKARDPDQLELRDGQFYEKGGSYVSLQDEEYFEDRSFTLTYSLVSGRWISFHSYKPTVYLWDRAFLYSVAKDGLWKHYSKEKFQTYYGDYYPSQVEFVVPSKSSYKPLETRVDMEVTRYEEDIEIHDPNVFFTDGMLTTRTQTTGWLPMKREDNGTPNAQERIKEGRHLKVKNVDGLWRYESSFNRVKNIIEPMFKDFLHRNPNEDNLGQKGEPLYDRYVKHRLSFNRPDNNDLQWTLYFASTRVDENVK